MLRERVTFEKSGTLSAITVPMDTQMFLFMVSIAVAAWAWLSDYVSETDFFP